MAMGGSSDLTLVLKAKNLASREIDGLHKSLNNAGKGVSGLKGAFVTLAKVGIIGVIAGIATVAATLFEATKRAADEQKGIAKLNAALKANDAHFKGNTDAIEQTIKKREALAFSSEDLRDSLTVLVTKFKDTNKALALQTTAMDLARLKGISLTDASALLGKGLDGNAKVLKQLGIVLPKTATQQERLTAIQHAAAGQAEAYGKTAAGAQESFQIAIGDLVKELGSNLLPVMATVFTWLRTDALPAIRAVAGAIGHWIDQNRPLINQILGFVGGALKTLISKLGDVVTWIGSIVATIASNKDAMNVLRTVASGIATAFGLAWQAVSTLIGWLASIVGWITSNKAVIGAFHAVWDGIASVIGGIADGLRTVIDLAGKALGALGSLNTPDAKFNGQSYAQAHGLGQHAAGGWVGLHGPEIGLLGEKGPEYIIPNHQLGSGGGGTPVVIELKLDGQKVGRLIDERLYYAIQRAPVARKAS